MSRSTNRTGFGALVAFALVTVLLVMSPAAPALAAETVTQTVPIDLENERDGLTSGGEFTFLEASPAFNQFDPALGTLLSATLSWNITGSENGTGSFCGYKGTGVFSYAGQSQTVTFDTSTDPGPKTFAFSGSTELSLATAQGTGTFVPSTFTGTITHEGCFPWSAEMSASGTITLTYVYTTDTSPPTWSNVPAPITVEATGSSGAVVTYATPTATDDVGVTSQGCAPASGATFPIGTTTVTCSASDAAGNTGTASFNVTVVDTTAPTVVVPASPLVAEATSATGAVVSYTATANDTVGGSRPTTCAPASGSTFPLGTTNVTCSATDAAGNTGTASFTVVVRDTTAPVLALPSSPVVVNAAGPSGATVTYTVTASDAVTAAPSVTCTPPSGSTFAIGTSTVSCTATDAAGNQAQGSFAVTVLGATDQVGNEITRIRGLGLAPVVTEALVRTLTLAQTEFNNGDVTRGCAYMTGYVAAVERLVLRGSLTSAQAAELTANANRIRAAAGCS